MRHKGHVLGVGMGPGVTFLERGDQNMNMLGKSLNITQEQKASSQQDMAIKFHTCIWLLKMIGHNQYEFKATNSKRIIILKYHLSMYETPYRYFPGTWKATPVSQLSVL